MSDKTQPADQAPMIDMPETSSEAGGNNATSGTGGGVLSFMPDLKIGGRLNAGFGAVCVVLAILVGVTLWKVSGIAETNKRIVDLRVPTSASSMGMINGINASLASLRGWMILGKDGFKAERAAEWAKIDKISKTMDRMSENWTNPANVKKWQGFKVVLEEFRVAQQQVEDVANTIDETPATKILVKDAAPKAQIMVGEITNIINMEQKLPATAERKALFAMMADVRGTTARGLANIRAFLLTGNKVFEKRFNTMWTKNKIRFAQLKAGRHLLSPQQQVSFDKLDAARTAFLPLPAKMFAIRGSNKWNMANYLLVTEAAPRANKLMTVLAGPKAADGSRSGGMVDNQKKLLRADADGANEEINALTVLEWILLAAGIAIAVGAAVLTGRSIVNPVAELTDAMTRLAGGDKSTEIPAQDRSDEVGTMAHTVQVFKENMIENDRLQAAQARQEEEQRKAEQQADEERRATAEKAQQERKKAMLEMADSFEASVMGVVDALASSATEMQTAAQTMASTAEQTNQQSSTVASASEEAAANVQTVAAATEELATSVQEVGRQVEESNRIANEAVEEAERTNAKVQGLADAANKIGEVVNLINDIANQTNLLALNATIEAARAGDAGKGFAVVASEVKSLATQTGKATEEIAGQIGDIQSATTEAVEAIGGISTTIAKISEIASSIAGAVEEQGATTQEIATNVQQAATGTQEISSNITQVNQAASETGSAATQVVSAAGELAQQGETLRAEVNKFLQTMRAA